MFFQEARNICFSLLSLLRWSISLGVANLQHSNSSVSALLTRILLSTMARYLKAQFVQLFFKDFLYYLLN